MKPNFISFSILVLLLISITQVQCALRFKDDEMMKTHHNHENLIKQGADPITVHLIPHSHDDVGWLKTVDDYYYGGDMSTQMAGVQYTIDAVVEQLSKNSTYKFSIVEVAFLYRWWNQANQTQRNRMKTLYANGQIEFLNGGWCMSDEAAPYYEDVIDQMTIGHRWLKQTFGAIPTAAWHIDPFGHQSSSASMFSQMGMQAFFFARIDYQDKNLRLNKKAMEMVWRPKQYNGQKSTYVFTHVNYYHYSPPPGFCFDIRCTDEPVKDNPDLGDYNLPTKAEKLVQYFKSMALHFRSSNLMHTLGEDFHYIDGNIWFKNVDKLINYINARSSQYGMTIKYSTPSEYINIIQKEGNTYPTKVDDFFPYSDNEHSFWTGYFTSRTALKGFIRELGKNIQSLRKQISELLLSNSSAYAFANKDKVESMIWELQMAQGILQHHDAVAGTSKQKVAYDYVNTALKALAKGKPILSAIKSEEIKKEVGQQIDSSNISYNMFWNQTTDATGIASMLNQNKTILIQLYNPGPKGTNQIRIKVPKTDLNVMTIGNQAVKGDVFCPNTIGNLVDQCELIFDLNFEQSSNNYVKIQKAAKASASAQIVDLVEFRIVEKTKTWAISNTANITMDRTSFQFNLQMKTGSEAFTVGYKYYESYQESGQKGGAYIFRPANDTAKPYSNIKKIYSVEGTQSLVIILEGTTTLTKLYFPRRQDYVENYGFEMETWLDSIPIDDQIGKQVCMSLKTNFDNQKTFFTDSNGLEEQVRLLNFRPTWNLTVYEAVAGNYYPLNSHIKITDPKSSTKIATILTDRSMGGAVIAKGEFELMLHRRLLADDWRGVDENLNETQVINGKQVGLTQSIRHYVVFGNNYRKVQKQNDQKILITIVPTSSFSFSPAQIRPASLKVPDSVKLYLRPMFNTNSYLLRLHNMDTENPAIVMIPDGWKVTDLTMSANQEWSEWSKKQYKWNEQAVNEKSMIKDIEENLYENVEALAKWLKNKASIPSANPQATQINLRPFDMRTMRLEKV